MTNTGAPEITLAKGAKIKLATRSASAFTRKNGESYEVFNDHKVHIFMWCKTTKSVHRIGLFSVLVGFKGVQVWGGPLVEGPWGGTFSMDIDVDSVFFYRDAPELIVYLMEGALVELAGTIYEVRDDLPNSWPRLVAI